VRRRGLAALICVETIKGRCCDAQQRPYWLQYEGWHPYCRKTQGHVL